MYHLLGNAVYNSSMPIRYVSNKENALVPPHVFRGGGKERGEGGRGEGDAGMGGRGPRDVFFIEPPNKLFYSL